MSLSFLRNKIPEEYQPQFVENTGICLNCGAAVREHEGEIVCERCGEVWDEEMDFAQEIPFETEAVQSGHAESHFSPSSQLAFGRAVGPGVDGRQLFKILGKAPEGLQDLPLRASQIRCITQRLDHPSVENLLSFASKLCKDYGLHTNSEANVQFANVLGRQLRKVGGYFAFRNERSGAEARRVAGCLFYLLFLEKNPVEAPRVYAELNLDEQWIHYAKVLLDVLTAPKQPKKPKRKQSED